MKSRFLLVIITLLFPCLLTAKDVRLTCSADLAIRQHKASFSNDYTEANLGKADILPFHGIHYTGGPNECGSLMLFNFDMTPLKSKIPGKATLYLRGENDISELSVVSVSTVSSPWVEGDGVGDSPVDNGAGASSHWASYKKHRWIKSDPQSELIDISFGFGYSMWESVRVRHEQNGWIAIDIPQKIMNALNVGASYGIALSEDKGQLNYVYKLFSRESSGNEPYMSVTDVIDGDNVSPNSFSYVSAEACTDLATMQTGAINIEFKAPKGDVVAYHVTAESLREKQPVPRYIIPFPLSAGSWQKIKVTGIAPEQTYTFSLSAVGRDGTRSRAVRVSAKSSPVLPATTPLVIKNKEIHSGQPLSLENGIKVWAYDANCKAHPVSGNLLEEVGLNKYAGPSKGIYRQGNYIWNGKKQSVEISGCKNEFVTFNLCVEAVNGLSKGHINIGNFRSAKDNQVLKMPFSTIYRIWYLKDGEWMPELALPVQDTFSIPARDNKISGQKNQSFLVELLVPRGAEPGKYTGSLIFKAENKKSIEIPVELSVWNFELPDKLSFNVELNAYDWRACTTEYFRVAHFNRATLNALPYTQEGVVNPATVPILDETSGKMKIKNWHPYEKTYGALYDGSAFKDAPRKGVPIPVQYLPMHENWPAGFHANIKYNPQKTDYPEWVKDIALNAPPVDDLFSKDYTDSFVKITREFVDHFKEKKWQDTEMQFYLNNKRSFNKGKMSWWILDEPQHIDDVLALRFYGNLFKSGLTEKEKSSFVFRTDISRPQFSRNLLDDVCDCMYVSRAFFDKNNLIQKMIKDGMKFIQYGTANRIRTSNLTTVLWPLRAYIYGADGILPWDSFGKEDNYTRPSSTALLILGKPVGFDTVLASLRLKSMRRGEQDIEYLKLLEKKKGYNRQQIQKLVLDVLNMQSSVETRDRLGFEDAGSITFDNVNSQQLYELRRAIANALLE